jgi:hypothetical protein
MGGWTFDDDDDSFDRPNIHPHGDDELLNLAMYDCDPDSIYRHELTPPSLDNFPYETQQMAYEMAPSLDSLIPKAIAKAMIHTKQVARRQHQKSDRIERVQHFITDLHREICGLRLNTSLTSTLESDLCQRSLWYDAGELERNYLGLRNTSWAQLQTWVETARTMTLGLEEQCSVIEGDIEGLKTDLGNIHGVTTRMARINEQADEVYHKFMSLLTE